jgi:hypothetical protein
MISFIWISIYIHQLPFRNRRCVGLLNLTAREIQEKQHILTEKRNVPVTPQKHNEIFLFFVDLVDNSRE